LSRIVAESRGRVGTRSRPPPGCRRGQASFQRGRRWRRRWPEALEHDGRPPGSRWRRSFGRVGRERTRRGSPSRNWARCAGWLHEEDLCRRSEMSEPAGEPARLGPAAGHQQPFRPREPRRRVPPPRSAVAVGLDPCRPRESLARRGFGGRWPGETRPSAVPAPHRPAGPSAVSKVAWRQKFGPP